MPASGDGGRQAPPLCQAGQETPGTLSAYSNAILFAGYYRDSETGLYNVRNRYYHLQLGWITRDPLGYVDGASLYEYCGSGPAGGLDPSGLEILIGTIPWELYGPRPYPWYVSEAIRPAPPFAGELLRPVPPIPLAPDFPMVRERGAEHTKDARPSTKDKHETGQARKQADKPGGEKGDAKRPFRKRNLRGDVVDDDNRDASPGAAGNRDWTGKGSEGWGRDGYGWQGWDGKGGGGGGVGGGGGGGGGGGVGGGVGGGGGGVGGGVGGGGPGPNDDREEWLRKVNAPKTEKKKPPGPGAGQQPQTEKEKPTGPGAGQQPPTEKEKPTGDMGDVPVSPWTTC